MESITVELWRASLPKPLSTIADHHWFVLRGSAIGATVTPAKPQRWEVWQRQNAGGESTGHVYRNLMAPDRGVGGGPAECIYVWQGAEAENLERVLVSSMQKYPYRNLYRYWPGPNSNTFVAWILKVAGLANEGALLLGAKAIGKNWRELSANFAAPRKSDVS